VAPADALKDAEDDVPKLFVELGRLTGVPVASVAVLACVVEIRSSVPQLFDILPLDDIQDFEAEAAPTGSSVLRVTLGCPFALATNSRSSGCTSAMYSAMLGGLLFGSRP